MRSGPWQSTTVSDGSSAETKSAGENLRHLSAAVPLAEEVVALLAGSEALLGTLSAQPASPMSSGFIAPSRMAGELRLQQFLPGAGRRYREERNIDRGAGRHHSVSGLSPYIRHRLLSESEVLAAVLGQHSRSAADKFIQEVFWRGYWKGWLEQRPAVWQDYLDELGLKGSALATDADLSRRYQAAVDGQTGILPFDEWSRELGPTGDLHNHARMWFASIWIFTLDLPWVLGADFFLRHLFDGDPASNTLSWRWVAGLHTRGKTYLATEHNIRRYASERFDLDPIAAGLERLSRQAEALEAPAHPPAARLVWPTEPTHRERVGVLLTEEDLLLDFPVAPLAVAALHVDSPAAEPVQQFKTGALQDALSRAAQQLPSAEVNGQPAPVEELVAWAQQSGLEQLWVAYAPVGYVREQVDRLEAVLMSEKISLVRFTRTYDRLVWPHCTKGFFQLRKRIPDLLDALFEEGPASSGMMADQC